ncbi:MAG: enoyl-CoA hydratase/isomerase family protein [Pseudomonadota bacterium]
MTDSSPTTHESAEFSYAVSDGIGHFVFQRPEQRNALTFAMYEGLAKVCATMPDDASVRALIVSGEGGKAFAAGTDISLFRDFTTAEQALGYETKMAGILSQIERCPVPTIAVLTGACTGGGAAIATVCDLRIADNKLRFGFPIARTLGNCLSAWNLSRLADLIGVARLKEIILTNRLIESAEAQAIGLISSIHESPEAASEAANMLAKRLAEHAPLTMRATKESLRRLQDAASQVDDEDLIALCYTSTDFREGMTAFLEKRAPKWSGT